MMTTYERGKIEGQRELVLWMLEKTFGPVTAKVKEHVATLAPEKLRPLLLDIVNGVPLSELHLEDEPST
jgi:hypothetical protein